MRVNRISALIALSFLLFMSTAVAQNKVVVIPMAGDDLKPLANIVTVAKANGDFSSPVAAMDSITDASVNKPYLLIIAPGEYNLGASQLVMKPYVEVAGSGRVATRLIGARGSATTDGSAAMVTGASNSSLSDLSIINTRTNSNSFGIHNFSVSNMTINNIAISIVDGPASGFQVGIRNDASSPKITQVYIELEDGGAQGGVLSFNSSQLEIAEIEIKILGGNSSQNGILSFGSPTSIKHASINVAGGDFNQTGLNAGSASPIDATGLKITVEGGGTTNNQIGIDLKVQPQDGESKITQSTIDVKDGTDASGIKVTQAGLVRLEGVSAFASNASGVNYGLSLNSSVQAKIYNSTFSGATNSVLGGGPGNQSTAYISDSFLEGPRSSNGIFRCSFVHTTAGSVLDGNCSSGI